VTDWPSFSVIIPTYQRRETVCEVLRALSAIVYKGAIELIVVVDGSTDGTADAVGAIECPFELKIVSQDNRGAAAARNRGATEATGEILLFLDDDMLCAADLVAQHARMYAEGADAVVGDFPTDLGSPDGFLTNSIAEQAHWSRDNARLTPFDVFTGQLSVKRSVFEELGGFDESFTANGRYGNEDIDFGARLLSRFEVRHNPAAICRQRAAVAPREYMRRAASVARADMRFAAKHPQLADQLFERRGYGRTSRRLRLLSRVPGLPRVVARLAVSAAEIGLKTPLRSSPTLSHFFTGAYLVTYWSAIRSEGGPRL
jgi:glycosyltransferase involved in cell wall biosynthesis